MINHRLQRGVVRKIVLIITLLYSLTLFGDDYRLGEGLQIEKTPLYLGGYFSFNYGNDLNGSSKLVFDDIALMFYGQKDAWSFMVEAEMNDVYYNQFELNEDSNTSFRVHAERVYARYAPSDTLRVTVGKFNSPIGFWNLMPINVLRATTSSPLIVEQIFPRFTTGADVDLSFQQKHRLTVMLQATPDLDTLFHGEHAYNNIDIDRHLGLGYTECLEHLTLRFNGGYFRERVNHEEWYYMYAALEYRRAMWEVLSEAGYRKQPQSGQKLVGGYLQVSRTFYEAHQLVTRIEAADDNAVNRDDELILLGYTYRPVYPVALKSEVQWRPRINATDLLFSFSVLF